MKKMFLFFVLCLSSCANKRNIQSGKYVEIYKTEVYDNCSILYGTQKHDTIVFITKTKFIEDCGWNSKYIDKSNLPEITNIVTAKGDSLIFTHVAKDTNNRLSITVGGGSPGQMNNKYIHTFSKYPRYIDKCESFR